MLTAKAARAGPFLAERFIALNASYELRASPSASGTHDRVLSAESIEGRVSLRAAQGLTPERDPWSQRPSP
jgi:hypothetical protein